MTSKQKKKIARQNGAKAAGAKSPEGIQTSSMNATRHGLLAKALVLSNESQAKFDELLLMYLDRFRPQDGVETNLVYEMVAAKWRQQRVWMAQTCALELEMDDQQLDLNAHESKGGGKIKITEPERITMALTRIANNEKTLELLQRYETGYSRMHDRAIKALYRLRENSNLPNDPEPAETVSAPPAGAQVIVLPKPGSPPRGFPSSNPSLRPVEARPTPECPIDRYPVVGENP